MTNPIADAVSAATDSLPAPGKIADQRAAALRAFRSEGLPNTRNEAWRYTDISALGTADISFRLPSQFSGPVAELLPIDAQHIVFVNGNLADTRNLRDTENRTDVSILTNDWTSLSEGFPLNGEVAAHPLGRLNTAGAQHGVLIEGSPESENSEVLCITLIHSGDAALALQPRIVLNLKERASVRVILHCISDNSAAGWINNVVEVSQAPDSSLELIQLQEHAASQTQTSLITASLERGASASVACFDLGAKLARNDVEIRLNGEGSEAEIFGTFLPIDSQHIDTRVCIDHAAAHTRSSTSFRGIAGAKSRGVFNGKVIVRPNAQKISAEQSSDNLLLAPDAEIDTKPELEIYADDVKCSHGATVGELDEQHLFYLRSRGIDDAAARALLTNAFAQRVVDQVSDPAIRDTISARIAQRLPEHERWEQLI